MIGVGRRGCPAFLCFKNRDRVDREEDREHDGPAVQVALHERAARGAAGHADAERAGHARVLTGVQEHQEDDRDRDRHLSDRLSDTSYLPSPGASLCVPVNGKAIAGVSALASSVM